MTGRTGSTLARARGALRLLAPMGPYAVVALGAAAADVAGLVSATAFAVLVASAATVFAADTALRALVRGSRNEQADRYLAGLVSDQPGDEIVRRRRRELLRPARRAALAESIELCVRRALAPPRGADARLTVPVNRRAVVANVEPLRELEARLGDTDRPLRATAPAIAMFLTTCADSPVYDPRATPAELRQLLRRALLSSGAR